LAYISVSAAKALLLITRDIMKTIPVNKKRFILKFLQKKN